MSKKEYNTILLLDYIPFWFKAQSPINGFFIILIGDYMIRRLLELREDSNLKQQELADYLNCSQVSYSRYELGSREVPVDVLIKLAIFYGTSVDFILGLTDVSAPYPRST